MKKKQTLKKTNAELYLKENTREKHSSLLTLHMNQKFINSIKKALVKNAAQT